MGRTKELINYINEHYEPIKEEKKGLYSHISFSEERKKLRKEYRKKTRRQNDSK